MILRKIKTFVLLCLCGIRSVRCVNNAHFYTADETVKIICEKKISIIRWGDGEFDILRGKSVSYQPWSKDLQEEMEIIAKEYIKGVANYLLCMPGEFLIPSIFEMNGKHLKSWIFSRFLFKEKYDIEISYGDAFLFAKNNEPIYKKIWENNKPEKIIFVHNNYNYANQFEKQYGIKTIFVEVPSKDCFSNIDAIENNIYNYADNETLVLISAGPAAKVIVKNLSNKGIWCIDTGHCWDEPLLLRK